MPERNQLPRTGSLLLLSFLFSLQAQNDPHHRRRALRVRCSRHTTGRTSSPLPPHRQARPLGQPVQNPTSRRPPPFFLLLFFFSACRCCPDRRGAAPIFGGTCPAPLLAEKGNGKERRKRGDKEKVMHGSSGGQLEGVTAGRVNVWRQRRGTRQRRKEKKTVRAWVGLQDFQHGIVSPPVCS